MAPTEVEPSTLQVGIISPTESGKSSNLRQRSKVSSLSHKGLCSCASTAGSGTSDESLKEQLRRGRRECPRRPHSFFIPISTLDQLITCVAVAKDMQKSFEILDDTKALEKADDVCRQAKRLYAVLAYVKKGASITSLMKDDITDKDLPLVRQDDDQGLFALSCNSGKLPHTFEAWSEKDREKFDRVQWWVMAPIFKDKEHYELADKAVLPYIHFKQSEDMKITSQGGYSEVFPVRLHPSHHTFWKTDLEDEEPLVAIKRLISPDEKEFEKEVSFLRTLGSKSKPHAHLIRLLATYRQKQKYHLMFPYANENLMEYWTEREPTFDIPTVMWCIKQMTGIADAVRVIHNFRVTVPPNVASCGEQSSSEDVELSVGKGEELYGRHGDIKAENILWFEKTLECSDERGVLQIADFGLSRFHGRDSRSNVPPESVWGSPTYEPPECKLNRPVSRAYDMWSLGCLYLEFVTWLLMGSVSIEGFSDARERPITNKEGVNFTDENFFTIVRDSAGGLEAVVRESVVSWADSLYWHKKCSNLIHDLLDIIMDHLLLIDSKDRLDASLLCQNLNSILKRAEKDQDYTLKPVAPLKNKNHGGRSQSDSDVLKITEPFPSRSTSSERVKNSPLPLFPESERFNWADR